MAEKSISIVEMHHRKTPHGILVWGTGINGSEIRKTTSHIEKRSEECSEDDWTNAFIECQKRIIEMFHPEDPVEIEAPEKPTEPDEETLYENIKTVIDDIGYKIAMDSDLSLEEKIRQWVDLLKWVLPHIPKERRFLRECVEESIKTPNQWDFMEKPRHY